MLQWGPSWEKKWGGKGEEQGPSMSNRRFEEWVWVRVGLRSWFEVGWVGGSGGEGQNTRTEDYVEEPHTH